MPPKIRKRGKGPPAATHQQGQPSSNLDDKFIGNEWDYDSFIMCALFDYIQTHSECEHKRQKVELIHAEIALELEYANQEYKARDDEYKSVLQEAKDENSPKLVPFSNKREKAKEWSDNSNTRNENKDTLIQEEKLRQGGLSCDCKVLYNKIIKLFMMMDTIHDFAKDSRGFKENYDKYPGQYKDIRSIVDWNNKISYAIAVAYNLAMTKIIKENYTRINDYINNKKIFFNTSHGIGDLIIQYRLTEGQDDYNLKDHLDIYRKYIVDKVIKELYNSNDLISKQIIQLQNNAKLLSEQSKVSLQTFLSDIKSEQNPVWKGFKDYYNVVYEKLPTDSRLPKRQKTENTQVKNLNILSDLTQLPTNLVDESQLLQEGNVLYEKFKKMLTDITSLSKSNLNKLEPNLILKKFPYKEYIPEENKAPESINDSLKEFIEYINKPTIKFEELKGVFDRFNNFMKATPETYVDKYEYVKLQALSTCLKIIKPKRRIKNKKSRDNVKDLCNGSYGLLKILVANLNHHITTIFMSGNSKNTDFNKVFIDPYHIDNDQKQKINSISVGFFHTRQFRSEWEKKLLTMLCRWGRVKTLKMMKYINTQDIIMPSTKRTNINQKALIKRNASVVTSEVLEKPKDTTSVEIAPTFFTFYVKDLSWSRDFITSKERKLIDFLNLNLFSKDGKEELFPYSNKIFLVTAYFDGCKGTVSGAFGTDILRDKGDVRPDQKSFKFSLNFADDNSNNTVSYIYNSSGNYLHRLFPNDFGKGGKIIETWKKTAEDILEDLEDEEELQPVEDEDNDINEQDEDDDIPFVGKEFQQCNFVEDPNVKCIWKRVDKINVNFIDQDINIAIAKVKAAQTKIKKSNSMTLKVDKDPLLVINSLKNIKEDIGAEAAYNPENITVAPVDTPVTVDAEPIPAIAAQVPGYKPDINSMNDDDQNFPIPAIPAIPAQVQDNMGDVDTEDDHTQPLKDDETEDNMEAVSTQDAKTIRNPNLYIKSSVTMKNAANHLVDSKKLIRTMWLHSKHKQPGDRTGLYKPENDYHYIMEKNKTNEEPRETFDEECKAYTGTNPEKNASEFVDNIGFFTTLKCIGDFSQCMEAYHRGCMFFAGDSMQFILGSSIGSKMIKNHVGDFKQDAGKHFWVSDSLFNYIFNRFSQRDDRFNTYTDNDTTVTFNYINDIVTVNDETTSIPLKIPNDKDNHLKTFINIVENRNDILCINQEDDLYEKERGIKLWFSTKPDGAYNISDDTSDNLLSLYNTSNIKSLIEGILTDQQKNELDITRSFTEITNARKQVNAFLEKIKLLLRPCKTSFSHSGNFTECDSNYRIKQKSLAQKLISLINRKIEEFCVYIELKADASAQEKASYESFQQAKKTFDEKDDDEYLNAAAEAGEQAYVNAEALAKSNNIPHEDIAVIAKTEAELYINTLKISSTALSKGIAQRVAQIASQTAVNTVNYIIESKDDLKNLRDKSVNLYNDYIELDSKKKAKEEECEKKKSKVDSDLKIEIKSKRLKGFLRDNAVSKAEENKRQINTLYIMNSVDFKEYNDAADNSKQATIVFKKAVKKLLQQEDFKSAVNKAFLSDLSQTESKAQQKDDEEEEDYDYGYYNVKLRQMIDLEEMIDTIMEHRGKMIEKKTKIDIIRELTTMYKIVSKE